MNGPGDERLLAFLEGEMEEAERLRLLEELERDPELAASLRSAAAGLEAVHSLRGVARARSSRRISPWWVAVAAAATLAVSVPGTLLLAGRGDEAAERITNVVPEPDEPSFVLILHGRWPDASTLSPAEFERRATEYWAWASSLAVEDVLLAAGDLRWEPGALLGPGGVSRQVSTDVVESDDFLVGMFALRARSYEEALALARDCPHLRYGGSVSVRRVGMGFVTTPGLGDWEG